MIVPSILESPHTSYSFGLSRRGQNQSVEPTVWRWRDKLANGRPLQHPMTKWNPHQQCEETGKVAHIGQSVAMETAAMGGRTKGPMDTLWTWQPA
ncbi:unnamed protein product [Staurois parvus]|uniref:Uncharacterized protein n=1 Tax=Staurois parvus TaxID=386267 RepID=A0ABN9F9D7_9NEOB|nr:unnamed protein product [Staurois parvus]